MQSVACYPEENEKVRVPRQACDQPPRQGFPVPIRQYSMANQLHRCVRLWPRAGLRKCSLVSLRNPYDTHAYREKCRRAIRYKFQQYAESQTAETLAWRERATSPCGPRDKAGKVRESRACRIDASRRVVVLLAYCDSRPRRRSLLGEVLATMSAAYSR